MKIGTGLSFQIYIAALNDYSSIKAVQILDIALPPSSSGRLSTTIICTASSDGKIHLYDAVALPSDMTEEEKPVEISPLVTYDSKGTRLTCLTLGDGGADVPEVSAGGKRKHTDEDSASDEENGNESDSDDHSVWGGLEVEVEGEEEEVEGEEEEDSD